MNKNETAFGVDGNAERTPITIRMLPELLALFDAEADALGRDRNQHLTEVLMHRYGVFFSSVDFAARYVKENQITSLVVRKSK